MKDWDSGAIQTLTALYVQQDTTTDDLIKDPDVLIEFTNLLNSRLGQTFSPEEVGGELLKLRKSKKLPKLRR